MQLDVLVSPHTVAVIQNTELCWMGVKRPDSEHYQLLYYNLISLLLRLRAVALKHKDRFPLQEIRRLMQLLDGLYDVDSSFLSHE
jgi:hypothetical protein